MPKLYGLAGMRMHCSGAGEEMGNVSSTIAAGGPGQTLLKGPAGRTDWWGEVQNGNRGGMGQAG